MKKDIVFPHEIFLTLGTSMLLFKIVIIFYKETYFLTFQIGM